MYEKALIRAGLDQKQAKIYIACLELGKSKAPAIAKKAEVKRTTTYGILDELVALGLVSVAQAGKVKYYKAQDPEVILDMIENNRDIVAKAVPGLRDMFLSFHSKPAIQFFEGREGIKRIYEDTLTNQAKKVLQIVRVKDFISYPGSSYAREYTRKRAALGITAYALNSSLGDVYDETNGKESVQWKRHVRYLPPQIFHAAMIMIYDNKVAMVSTKEENFGFIIESKEFSSTLKAYFEFMWKMGSKQAET